MRVIIAGGGIGGLALAVGLRRVGIDCCVLERAAEYRRVGAGLVVWTNAMLGLRQLGVAEAIESSSVHVDVCRFADARGRTLLENHIGTLQQRYGAPTVGIHRADLIETLYDALPAQTVRFAAEVADFQQDERGVRVRLQNGESLQGDLLVGADGIRSRIRTQLFPGNSPRPAGYAAWRGIASLRTSDCPLGSWRVFVGPGSHFGLMPLSDTQLYWFATMNTPPAETGSGANGSDPQHRADVIRRFTNWHPLLTLAASSTPPDRVMRTDVHDLPTLRRWSRGRVTLLGDAAHAATPDLGQGACQAIEDAVVLAANLAGDRPLAAALAGYEKQRRRRTAWVMRESRRAGRLMNVEKPWATRLRDWALRLSTTRLALRPMNKICRNSLPQLAGA